MIYRFYDSSDDICLESFIDEYNNSLNDILIESAFNITFINETEESGNKGIVSRLVAAIKYIWGIILKIFGNIKKLFQKMAAFVKKKLIFLKKKSKEVEKTSSNKDDNNYESTTKRFAYPKFDCELYSDEMYNTIFNMADEILNIDMAEICNINNFEKYNHIPFKLNGLKDKIDNIHAKVDYGDFVIKSIDINESIDTLTSGNLDKCFKFIDKLLAKADIDNKNIIKYTNHLKDFKNLSYDELHKIEEKGNDFIKFLQNIGKLNGLVLHDFAETLNTMAKHDIRSLGKIGGV